MKKIILLALLSVWAGNILLLAQQNDKPAEDTILKSAKDTIQDPSIVYPESITGRLDSMLHNWQLDFSDANAECARGRNTVFHDSVYADRLYRMPSEMELSYNHVVKSYIDMYADRKRDLVSYMLTLGDYYFPMFEEALDRYGLPLELKYLPVIESALNPVAVSRAGATGLWQFMLRTGKGYGLEVNSLVDERRDPYKATEAAVRYLRDLYQIYGDWNLVIAAYNCGPGNVNKAITRSGGKRDYWEIYYQLPRETRGYVPAFIAANYIMNHYPDHNICPIESFGSMTALDTVHVNERIHFNQIAEILDVPVSEIRRLNPQFKKDIIPGNNRAYALVLPTNKMYAFVDQWNDILDHKKAVYHTHRVNTDDYLYASSGTSGSGGNTANVFYRVRKGDNLSKIARSNGVSIKQLKSWNGLKSDRLSIGKQLVVQKKTVKPEPQPQSETSQTEYKRAENAPSSADSNIISGYLKEQIEKAEERKKQEEPQESGEPEQPEETVTAQSDEPVE